MNVVWISSKTHPAEFKITFLTKHMHTTPVFVNGDSTVWTGLTFKHITSKTKISVYIALGFRLIFILPFSFT